MRVQEGRLHSARVVLGDGWPGQDVDRRANGPWAWSHHSAWRYERFGKVYRGDRRGQRHVEIESCAGYTHAQRRQVWDRETGGIIANIKVRGRELYLLRKGTRVCECVYITHTDGRTI